MGKLLILTALLMTEPSFTEFTPPEKIEMKRKRGKQNNRKMKQWRKQQSKKSKQGEE